MLRSMLLTAALAAGLVVSSAHAQTWPDKPVKLIVPYAPGGASDTIARPWAERLTQALGQQFVIENRGGAGGAIGAEAAAKSPPDGYTLLLTPNAVLSVLPQLRKTAYDPQKAFAPVGQVGDLIAGFVIHPSVGVKTMPELIAYAKKNPGKLAYGSAGLGTATHLRIEMLKYKTGVDILHVPYRGSADALADLLPGNVQMMNEIVVLPHVKAGKLVLLGVNHATRHPDFPDVPTLTEAGIQGADVPIWYSIWAPASMPAAIVDKLNKTIVEIAGTDSMKQRMREINVYVPLQTPAEMTARLEGDIKANGELIKAANIKLD
jgi:tripartite-type tricarboxylate transporter receptor subunit TctC